jgi:hypothetical protein
MDARADSYAEVRPASAGVLRVCAHVPEGDGTSDVSGLRVLLVADLLTRIAELGDLQVFTVLASDSWSPEQTAGVARLTDRLGMHPPAARASCRDAPAALGGAIDVHLVSGDASADDHQSGLVVRVGDVRMRLADQPDKGTALASYSHEPHAVRLALMSFLYHQQPEVNEGILAGARETLGRWRGLVASWAEVPSKPVPARITEAAQAAFSDLDTVSVLDLLRSLALETVVPAGAKFEAFLYADRVLGLELAREIGQPARGGCTLPAGIEPVPSGDT